MKKVLFLLIVILFGLSFQAKAVFAQIATPTDGQGLYESCGGNTLSQCFTRMDEMSAAGFKTIIDYDDMWYDSSRLISLMDYAKTKNIKVILAMYDSSFRDGTNLLTKFSDMAATCKKIDSTACKNNNDFITYVVNLVKNHPALWGYYIGDEVPINEHNQLKVVTDLIHQLDPNHPRIIIQTNETNTTNGVPGVTQNLTPFVDTADVIGVDYYPIGSGGYGESLSQTGNVAKEVQRIATLYGKGSAMVLQAFSWAEYPDHDTARCTSCPYPTLSDLTSMLTQTLQNSTPQVVLWYSYFDIKRASNPTGLWSDLVAASSISQPVFDYVPWKNNFGRNLSGISNGDFNNDGKVNGVDYVLWLKSQPN